MIRAIESRPLVLLIASFAIAAPAQTLPVKSKVVTLSGNRPTTVTATAASPSGIWVAGTTYADNLGLPGAFQRSFSATPNLSLYSTGGGEKRPLGNIPDQNLRQVVAHPSDPSLLYCITDTGIYRSRDAGKSFELLRLPPFIPGLFGARPVSIHVSASQPAVLYLILIGLNAPFFRSSNYGDTWEPGLPSPPGTLTVAEGPEGCLLITNLSQRSDDCGRTWRSLDVPLTWSLVADPRSSGKLYVYGSLSRSAWQPALFVSEDWGGRWRSEPLTEVISNIALDPQASGRLYLLRAGEILATEDLGRTVTLVRKIDVTDPGLPGIGFRLEADFRTGSLLLIQGGRAWETKDSFESLQEIATSPRGLYSLGAAGLLYQQADDAPDAFLAHFNHEGSLTAFTYLGGSGAESATALAVDAAGDVLISGATGSGAAFPFTQSSMNGGSGSAVAQGYLAKLSGSGARLEWATRLPAAPSSIALGNDGSIYLGGTTTNFRLPTTPGAVQPEFASGRGAASATNGFVARLRPDGVTPVYLTYYGQAGTFVGGSSSLQTVLADEEGNAYAAGSRVDFQPAGGLQQQVWKIDPSGTRLLWELLTDGGSQTAGWAPGAPSDYVSAGSISVETRFGFPRQTDAIVTRLTSSGQLVLRQQFGGSDLDRATAFALDASGNLIVTGYTQSNNFPTRSLIEGRTSAGLAFVTKFDGGSGQMLFSTYLNDIDPLGLAPHPEGGWWVVGTYRPSSGIGLIRLTETAATQPRVDALLQTGVITVNLTSTLRGAGFAADAKVMVGDAVAPSQWISAAEIRFNRPPGLAPGRYELRVEHPDGRRSAGIAVEVR